MGRVCVIYGQSVCSFGQSEIPGRMAVDID